MITPASSGRPNSSLQRDRGADHFREVAGGDGDFAEDPERECEVRRRVMIAAGLREVAAGGDAELGGERLEQDRHEVGDQNDAEQRVAELRAAAEVGGPVAGVHVADGDEVAGPGKCQDFADPRGCVRDGYRTMGLGERGQTPCAEFAGSRGSSGSSTLVAASGSSWGGNVGDMVLFTELFLQILSN